MFAQHFDFIDKVYPQNSKQIRWKPLHQTVYVLEPACCPDVWTAFQPESLRDVVLAIQAHASRAYHVDLVDMQPRVLLQMPTRSVIIASSRSLPTKSSRRLSDAGALTSSS